MDDANAPWCFFPEDAGYLVDYIHKGVGTMEVKLRRNEKYRYLGHITVENFDKNILAILHFLEKILTILF